MSQQIDERAFESHVQDILIERGGWKPGERQEWDQGLALFPARVLAFLQETQPQSFQAMQKLHGEALPSMLMTALVKELDFKGSLNVLRHGFKFYGKTFRLAYFKPAHGLSAEILRLYLQNQLTVTRQVPCHAQGNATVDLLFAVNGIPVATCELKNPITGQNWRHAVAQYKTDREPGAPLFQWKKRALVHFAADPDEIYMSTRLQKDETFFLPFNRGSHPGEIRCGAGNPPHASGYPSGYFWEDVLSVDSFLDILGSFLFFEKDEAGHDKKLVFPRYHQLDVVRKLIEAARTEGSGNHYLIQHSAGSGKTNSIAWLAHHLASLHDAKDAKVFDCVLVITDRRVLDDQLQDAIYQIEHAQGVAKAIDKNARQLAEALIDGTKIVVTTLQKFPFVLKGLLRMAGAKDQEEANEQERIQSREWEEAIAQRRYAVIVDEAHSSQTGESARELKALLGSAANEAGTEDEDFDIYENLGKTLRSRGRQPNLSFFAFTATPKGKTIELFGRRGSSGKPEAFHLYSMRQALEERFILDVVRNYTSYATYYRLMKAVEDDPKVLRKKASRTLAKYMSLHPYNLEQKTEVIIEHFRESVRHHLGGRAKAMVVTSSRLHAVRYRLSFERYLREKGYQDIRALVAFSGKVKDPDSGEEYTEPEMNRDCITGKPISESQLPQRFESPDYQILLVANKYQTGFDEPLLCAMYVDKRLDGVQAVQTLSRLNRMVAGKEEPFVLDFVNKPEDIYLAFKPYYDATSLQEESNPARLEELKHQLNQMQVYHWSEVESFARVFYRSPSKQRTSDHEALKKYLKPAQDRFKAIEEESKRQEFREKLNSYVRLYSFLSQIIPYGDPELEMLYSFAHTLLPNLPHDHEPGLPALSDEVGLHYYRLQRIYSGPIDLKEGDEAAVKSPTDVGTAKAKDEKAPLSEIIEVLNERFGMNLTEEDRLFFAQIKERAVKNEQVIKTAMANPFDKFFLGIEHLLEDFMIQRISENDQMVTKCMDNPELKKSVFRPLAKEIFEAIQIEQETQV